MFLKKAYEQGKSHFVVVVAEGAEVSAEELDEYVNGAGAPTIHASRSLVISSAVGFPRPLTGYSRAGSEPRLSRLWPMESLG